MWWREGGKGGSSFQMYDALPLNMAIKYSCDNFLYQNLGGQSVRYKG